jgi:pimeloyl-ACP methyl ester carboxylesterase
VVALDQRGHGGSPWQGRYTFDTLRDDVVALLDHLGWKRADVLGHSMGGHVAISIGIERGDRIRRARRFTRGATGGKLLALLARAAAPKEEYPCRTSKRRAVR